MPLSRHKALVIGIHDIRYPTHGGARLTLAILHALALNNHEIHYLAIDINNKNTAEVTKILTESRFGTSSMMMIRIRKLNPLTEIPYKLLSNDYNYILCLDRRYIMTCKALSRKLNVPLIMYMDSPLYLHPERLTSIKDHILRPVAHTWYAFIGYISDLTVCVSKYIEKYLRKWGIKAMTIEPTYALLHRSNDPLINAPNDDSKIDEIDSNVVLCSCPIDLSLLIALKNSKIPIVITGPAAYYTKEYLRSRGISIRNLYLLHNISDQALKALHDKIVLSLIARPALAGISITLIQELYFGKAIITDVNTATRIHGLPRANAVIINENYTEWPQLVNKMINNDYYLEEMGQRARRFFDNNLSPAIFARNFEYVLHSLNIR